MRSVFSMLLITFSFSAMSQLPKVSSGSVKRLENFPSVYVEARNIDIWLPANYDSKKKYATLYMHDGQALFDSTLMWNHQEWQVDETISRLLTENKIKNCIVIGIWNAGAKRWAEYFPEKILKDIPETQRKNLIKDEMAGKPLGDDYLQFIIKELKPFIDTHFAVYTDKANTFIAGSSMGAMTSLYAICEYPNIFGGAACISTHWPGSLKVFNDTISKAMNAYLEKHLPDPKDHKIYFDHGTATLDGYYKPSQLMIDATMKKAGYKGNNWITKEFPGADHSESSWSKRFYLPVLFLLTK